MKIIRTAGEIAKKYSARVGDLIVIPGDATIDEHIYQVMSVYHGDSEQAASVGLILLKRNTQNVYGFLSTSPISLLMFDKMVRKEAILCVWRREDKQKED